MPSRQLTSQVNCGYECGEAEQECRDDETQLVKAVSNTDKSQTYGIRDPVSPTEAALDSPSVAYHGVGVVTT